MVDKGSTFLRSELFEVTDEENGYNSDIKEWPYLGRTAKKTCRRISTGIR